MSLQKNIYVPGRPVSDKRRLQVDESRDRNFELFFFFMDVALHICIGDSGPARGYKGEDNANPEKKSLYIYYENRLIQVPPVVTRRRRRQDQPEKKCLYMLIKTRLTQVPPVGTKAKTMPTRE